MTDVVAYCGGNRRHRAATRDGNRIFYLEAVASKVKTGRIGVDDGVLSSVTLDELEGLAGGGVRVFCKACKDVYWLPLIEAAKAHDPIVLRRAVQ